MSIKEGAWNKILASFNIDKTSDSNFLLMLKEPPSNSADVTSHLPGSPS